jgi:hypothetical protein
MGKVVRGPFDLKWGSNTLLSIEEIEVDYDQDSESYKTVQHQTLTIDGAIDTGVTLTLLATDVAALAVVLPQYHVANGGTASTGETVTGTDGIIDVLALNCTQAETYNNLDIISCANPGSVYRLVNARTKLDSVEFDDKIRKVKVKFIGEPAQGAANIQFFAEGTLTPVAS